MLENFKNKASKIIKSAALVGAFAVPAISSEAKAQELMPVARGIESVIPDGAEKIFKGKTWQAKFEYDSANGTVKSFDVTGRVGLYNPDAFNPEKFRELSPQAFSAWEFSRRLLKLNEILYESLVGNPKFVNEADFVLKKMKKDIIAMEKDFPGVLDRQQLPEYLHIP